VVVAVAVVAVNPMSLVRVVRVVAAMAHITQTQVVVEQTLAVAVVALETFTVEHLAVTVVREQ
jgi:hypothetical protein